MVWTCTRGGADHRAVETTVLQAAGERRAISCPTHGIIAYVGFKPTGGVAAVTQPTGTDPQSLAAGEITKTAAGDWWIRPPRTQAATLVKVQVTETGGLLTVNRMIDMSGWRGWLESSVWLEEEV